MYCLLLCGQEGGTLCSFYVSSPSSAELSTSVCGLQAQVATPAQSLSPGCLTVGQGFGSQLT